MPLIIGTRYALERSLDAKFGGEGSFRAWVIEQYEEGQSIRNIAATAGARSGVTISARTLYSWIERWKDEAK